MGFKEFGMSLDLTPVHRNLHTKVTFLGLEFEDSDSGAGACRV